MRYPLKFIGILVAHEHDGDEVKRVQPFRIEKQYKEAA